MFLGEFDARAIAQFLIASYKGNIIIPKYGSYFHHSHLPRIRDGSLVVTGARYDDAVLIAKNQGLLPDTLRAENPFNEFVAAAMS